jgi:hypothetical protein
MFRRESARSLGFRTDLAILEHSGTKITEHEEFLRIETPDNPGFFWGNYLYFKRAPQPGDFTRWEETFRHEFRFSSGVRHRVFSWDAEEQGDIADFQQAGYGADTASVLTLRHGEIAPAPDARGDLEIRPLTSDADWEAMVQNQIACRLESFSRAEYEPFKRRQARNWRSMAEAGLGNWHGAFVEGKLVAECGLYFFKDLARFQAVGTAPEWRRQGLCQSLIHRLSRDALEARPHTMLVMAAAADEPAERIYRKVGFQPHEKSYGLCLRPLPACLN